jgi:hypothetical protein
VNSRWDFSHSPAFINTLEITALSCSGSQKAKNRYRPSMIIYRLRPRFVPVVRLVSWLDDLTRTR